MRGWLFFVLGTTMWAGQTAPKAMTPRTAAVVRLAGPAAAPPVDDTLIVTATPPVLTFTMSDPGLLPVVPANAPASVSFGAKGHGHAKWTLEIQANSATLLNCPGVPLSSVTVTCNSAVASGGGGSGTCAAPFPLSTTPQNVVLGREGKPTAFYTVTLTFTITDTWRYIAQLNPQCSLSVAYTAELQ